MFTAFQCAQFASCMGGHKNYDEYVSDNNQNINNERGTSADNPEPQRNGGGRTVIYLLIIFLIGWMSVNFIYDNYLNREMVIDNSNIVDTLHVQTSNSDCVSFEVYDGTVTDNDKRNSYALVVKKVYHNGIEKVDTITFERSLHPSTEWESVE